MTEKSNLYRDDLEAAQARAASLEGRLKDAEARIDELELPPEPPPSELQPPKSSPRKSKQASAPPQAARNGIVFRPPKTLIPLLRLCFSGLRTAARNVPAIPSKRSGSVALTILMLLIMVPVMHFVRVLYVLHLFLLVAPWTLLLSSILSVPLLIVLVLGSFRFEDSPSPKSSWLNGKSGGSTYLFILLAIAGQPFLPLYALGWDPTE